MSDLLLQEFTANSFLGIDKSSPVVIQFLAAKKNQNITTLTGDQGTRKTSTLSALMAIMGATFSFETKNLYNKTDEAIDVSLTFKYQGDDYEAKLTSNRLTLKKFYKSAGKDGKWIVEGSPKETLRTIFGAIGVSPMSLKDKSGKKQIEWFKENMGSDSDVSKKEEKKIAELKSKENERTEVGREVKSLKGWLDQNELYAAYEKSEAKFGKPINAEKEKKKFDEISNKKQAYDQYQNTVTVTKASLTDTNNQIHELEEKLKSLKQISEATSLSIEKGEKWLEEHKSIIKEHEEANKEWLNLSKNIADQREWKDVLAKEKEYNEKTDQYLQFDGDIDKLRQDLLKLTKSYLPKSIEGLEVKVKVKLDDEDEGIYYNGKSLAQLSESELWDLFVQIWAEKDVQFVFCENVPSLGSDAIETMNTLAKGGAKIFASAMQRGQDTMTITFETKIA